jgi:predicted TPR repeat methyltransferase
MTEPDPELGSAYDLNSDDDTRQLYADWAESYDDGFAVDMDYASPRLVADHFARAGGTGPVLDFGCGTGLAGDCLAALGVGPVDGIDITPEMLAVAGRKGIYRALIEGNILDGFDLPAGRYAGVISAGTFTHGHVGPEAIDALLRLAAPGALFALSINAKHYESLGFAAKFSALDGAITGLELPDVPLFGPGANGDHKDDRGYIALFRKAG